MWNGEEVLAALEAGGVALKVKRREGKGRTLVEIVLGGSRQEMLLTLRPLPGKAPATMKSYRDGAPWTVETLQEMGYPLYWSREWLARQFMDNKSLTAMELLTGYPRETLAIWKRRHSIVGNPRHDAIRRDWESGKFPTKVELAATYDISIPTLGRILKAQ